MKRLIPFLLLLFVFVVHASSPGGLKRRPIFGAQLVPSSSGGVTLGVVTPGKPAALAGLVTGDTIRSLNGRKIDNPDQFVAALKASNGSIELEVEHDGAIAKKKVELADVPLETSPDFDVVYDSAPAAGALRRTIITKPRDDKRHPAVLFAGGIGCYSLDGAPAVVSGYISLINDLTRRGFVVMRVEKSGMGDSEGLPCQQQDFENELAGYRAGLKKLKTYPYVDPQRVFLIGHSIGGLVAPVIASEESLRGVVVLSTAGRKWTDYEDVNAKRQMAMEGKSGKELDEALVLRGRCARKLLNGKQTPEAIIKANPRCEEYLHYPAHYTYMRQIAALDPAALWRKVAAPVLLIHGASDFVTDVDEHHLIETAVNAAHPGHATLIVEPNMDHFMREVPSREASMKALKENALESHPLQSQVRDDIAKWLTAHS